MLSDERMRGVQSRVLIAEHAPAVVREVTVVVVRFNTLFFNNQEEAQRENSICVVHEAVADLTGGE